MRTLGFDSAAAEIAAQGVALRKGGSGSRAHWPGRRARRPPPVGRGPAGRRRIRARVLRARTRGAWGHGVTVSGRRPRAAVGEREARLAGRRKRPAFLPSPFRAGIGAIPPRRPRGRGEGSPSQGAWAEHGSERGEGRGRGVGPCPRRVGRPRRPTPGREDPSRARARARLIVPVRAPPPTEPRARTLSLFLPHSPGRLPARGAPAVPSPCQCTPSPSSVMRSPSCHHSNGLLKYIYICVCVCV